MAQIKNRLRKEASLDDSRRLDKIKYGKLQGSKRNYCQLKFGNGWLKHKGRELYFLFGLLVEIHLQAS